MDRFLPMKGNVLSSDTWGADCVLPRYVDNGIEDGIWSYWGGNIRKGEDGKYHLFACGWLECSPKGHMEWPNSYVFHTISDNLTGPFKPIRIIGKGHNPEIFRAKNGQYVVYVINGRYVSDDLNGNGNMESLISMHATAVLSKVCLIFHLPSVKTVLM